MGAGAFLEGKEERGEGKMEDGGPLFFVIFFSSSLFFRYPSENDRNTQILKKKWEIDVSMFDMVMVMYVLRLGEPCKELETVNL